MADTNVDVDLETGKTRLVDHLIKAVNDGLRGNVDEELVGTKPSRTIFAGVLSAPSKLASNLKDGKIQISSTSIGLDFRLRIVDKTKPIILKIKTNFDIYYPVFPLWQQTLLQNKDVASIDPVVDLVEDEAVEEGEVSVAVDDLKTNLNVKGVVILPSVFKAKRIHPNTMNVDIDEDIRNKRITLKNEIESALEIGKSSVKEDSRLWRYLGEVGKYHRELGDKSVLSSESEYQKSLMNVNGPFVHLPEWASSIHLEVLNDTENPEFLRIRVLLANETKEPDWNNVDFTLMETALFNSRVEVEFSNGELIPFEFLLAPKDYRSVPLMPAKGINCVSIWDKNKPFLLSTESLPLYRQPFYRTNDFIDLKFSVFQSAECISRLEYVEKLMHEYLDKWDVFVGSNEAKRFNPEQAQECLADKELFKKEIENYHLGIDALKRDKKLLFAFQSMNDAFSKMNLISKRGIEKWRLFQIGFIVSQLCSISVRELSGTDTGEFEQHLRENFEKVSILWFPTGGGKTEAYLGLLAVALLYDRLRGKTRGVCAWMRFPLRMLSLQQLERLARVIAVLNVIKEENKSLLKGDPFSMGYFVGNGVTPNSVSEVEMKQYERDANLRLKRLLIRKCPFCNSKVEIQARKSDWRIAHVCTNSECFSNHSESLGHFKGSLPICIVDNEIYRYLPSVLVGTVDKLALISKNKYFVHLIRGANQKCSVHGYTSYDECIEHWSGCKAQKKDLQKLPIEKDPGPSFLIQDELHLLKAELGAFDCHYEGLIKYLCKQVNLPPKILAATATIEAYKNHAFHLYLSDAERYPQTGWELGESFYSTSKPLAYRRNYIGVLCHTRAIEEPAIRIMYLYIRELRRLKNNIDKVREVIGIKKIDDESILSLLRLYDFSLCYVNKKSTGGSILDKKVQIEKRLLEENLGLVFGESLTGDNTMEQVGRTIERIEVEKNKTDQDRLDFVVATNLISHGVDIERINMMAVCGTPSHYAEYVQSTSRSARSHPGMVFVCFKNSDARELSQYELFSSMHEHMDRLIEPVAVNRFASFVSQKTVPGLLAGILLCQKTPELYGKQISKTLDDVPTLKIALGKQVSRGNNESGCVKEDDLLTAIYEIIGVDKCRPPAIQAEIENVKSRVEEVFRDDIGRISRSLDKKLGDVLEPLISFRNVDEGIDFGSLNSSQHVERLQS